MKQIKTTFVLILMSTGVFAQSTLNVSGGGKIIGTNSYDYSIGQMTVVSSFISPSLVITQGVLQPSSSIATRVVTNTLQKDMKVYPNPSSAIVNIESNFKKSGLLKAALLDVNGRTVIYDEWNMANGADKNIMDIQRLSEGSYFLRLIFDNEETTFKILKIN